MLVLEIIGAAMLAWLVLPGAVVALAARKNPARLDPDDCYCTVLFDHGYPVVVEPCAFHNARLLEEAERITAETAL